jgi:hypothetical protein
MDFITAVKALMENRCERIRSRTWDEGVFVKTTLSGERLFLHTVTDDLILYQPTTYDILDETWELVPKPKVIKRIEGWINVYPNPSGESDAPGFVAGIYTSPEEARKCGVGILGDPLHIVHEYEVEE